MDADIPDPPRRCPALLIGAPASGQGKTTVTAALACCFRHQGWRVRVFKCGPDYLDPDILQQASGHPVHSLDLWMVGEQESRRRLWEAAEDADLILVEGVMGLYDGTPSAADLAIQLGLPVLLVVDAKAMAQTFGAIVQGLAGYRPQLSVAGVLANRVGSRRHADLLRQSLPAHLPWFGALPRTPAAQLPSRHLGLLPAAELLDLEARLQAATAALELVDSGLPAAVDFYPVPTKALPTYLQGVRIAVARDAAFAFLYSANLALLQAMGARLEFFSPLQDEPLPPVDSLYLPGGYPELHLTALQANQRTAESIRAHHALGKPILAECGGMLYGLQGLTDREGRRGAMLGLLPGEAHMQPRLAALGMQELSLPEGSLRGHSFHHSAVTGAPQPFAWGRSPSGSRLAEPVYRSGRLTASYMHFYFPSEPAAAAALLRP